MPSPSLTSPRRSCHCRRQWVYGPRLRTAGRRRGAGPVGGRSPPNGPRRLSPESGGCGPNRLRNCTAPRECRVGAATRLARPPDSPDHGGCRESGAGHPRSLEAPRHSRRMADLYPRRRISSGLCGADPGEQVAPRYARRPAHKPPRVFVAAGRGAANPGVRAAARHSCGGEAHPPSRAIARRCRGGGVGGAGERSPGESPKGSLLQRG